MFAIRAGKDRIRLAGTLRHLLLTSFLNNDTKPNPVTPDSPRVYMSTNPWKITATFQTIASSRDEYMAILEKVKEIAPTEPKAGDRRSKLETAHLALLKALQDRAEIIDNELAVSFDASSTCRPTLVLVNLGWRFGRGKRVCWQVL